jgi:hypothetical protein
MTKTDVFAAYAGWDNIANLDVAVGDDNPIDEQFDQLSALLKARASQPGLHAVAEVRGPLHLRGHVDLLSGLCCQMATLLLQSLELLLQLAAPSLILGQRHHPTQISLGQSITLLFQTGLPLP